MSAHLNEIVLSTLADGEEVPRSTHDHLEGCEACQRLLADAILEHAVVADALAAHEAPAAAAAPWGWIAAAAALLLVVRGAAFVESFGRAAYVRDLDHWKRGGTLVVRSLLAQSSMALGLAVVAAAVVLVVMLATWVTPPEQA